MRRLIVSDIHSNFDALQAVLRHAEGAYGEILCCGDLVGYGAQPAEVIRWCRDSVDAVIRGNHDRAVSELARAGEFSFNSAASLAVRWTASALSPQDLEWLHLLPQGPLDYPDYVLAHGSPIDEDEYLFDPGEVAPLRDVLIRPLTFVGHTHHQGGWVFERNGLRRIHKLDPSEPERVIDLEPDSLYLINPGSVGQPRDSDPRAAYALWDTEANTLALRRVAYPIAAAQSRILLAGLPEALAHRLSLGR
jgi:diadenosine tetraphosphatase ApaH/serine/threonine PP2A family protein phosphatase